MMRLSEIAIALNARLFGQDCEFNELSTDSRHIVKRGLFVALRGEYFDGHDFVESAAQQGACAIVVDTLQPQVTIPQIVVDDTLIALGLIAAVKRNHFQGKVVAVTGSSGKTTVKGMLFNIFSEKANTLATLGNFNNQIGVPLTLMRMSSEQYAVIELGTSHGGEIGYLTNLIRPDVALVTNIMPAHIGGFGSLDKIAEEKASVYLSDATSRVVINLDDVYADYFFEKTQGKNCIAYSVQKMNSDQYPVVFASNISYSDQGMPSFDLCYADEQVRLELQVPGLHNVSNALAASACAIASGLRLCDVVDGLQLYKSEKGRMCEKRSLNGVRVLDDTYNANPGSVRAAIDVLSACTGKKVLVLGDMGELGEFSKDSHRQIGCYAKQKNIDSVYTCGPLSSIAADTFGMGAFSFNDKQVLVTELKRVIDTNTTVLVKGSRTAKMEDIVKELCSPGEALSC